MVVGRQLFLKYINMYVNSVAIEMATVETVSVGIQNRNTLNSLLSSRLAQKNNAKNRAARIQNSSEKILSTSPPATAASPVAFSVLIPLKTDHEPGTNSARNNAASPLRMPLA